MKKFFFLLFNLLGATAYSQEQAPSETYQPDLYFAQEDFGESFAVMAEPGDDYNYYVVDLTRFAGWKEKTCFLNLIYEDNILISIDSDITKEQLWLKAPVAIAETEVTCALDEMKEKAVSDIRSMTKEEEANWLEKNKKFGETK